MEEEKAEKVTSALREHAKSAISHLGGAENGSPKRIYENLEKYLVLGALLLLQCSTARREKELDEQGVEMVRRFQRETLLAWGKVLRSQVQDASDVSKAVVRPFVAEWRSSCSDLATLKKYKAMLKEDVTIFWQQASRHAREPHVQRLLSLLKGTDEKMLQRAEAAAKAGSKEAEAFQKANADNPSALFALGMSLAAAAAVYGVIKAAEAFARHPAGTQAITRAMHHAMEKGNAALWPNSSVFVGQHHARSWYPTWMLTLAKSLAFLSIPASLAYLSGLGKMLMPQQEKPAPQRAKRFITPSEEKNPQGWIMTGKVSKTPDPPPESPSYDWPEL